MSCTALSYAPGSTARLTLQSYVRICFVITLNVTVRVESRLKSARGGGKPVLKFQKHYAHIFGRFEKPVEINEVQELFGTDGSIPCGRH